MFAPLFDTAWWGKRAQPGTPGVPKPAFVKWVKRLGFIFRVAHRPVMVGEQNVPRDRPFLLIANHSGGFATSEIMCFVLLYLERLEDVRLTALAHPFAFHLWPFTEALRGVGAIPSTYEHAHAALEDGLGILVFPGGDYEVSRPFWKANEVDFNRRKGFLKIAKKAGVDIVPMGIRGSHWTVPTLWRSQFVLPRLYILPRLFGLKRYPLSLFAVLGAGLIAYFGLPVLGWPLTLLFVWLWMACPLNLVPILPMTVRFHVGEPLKHEQLFADDDLERAYDEVVAAVQAMVDAGGKS